MTIAASQGPRTVFDRFAKLNWPIITVLCALAFVGVLMHFSVSSGAWTDMPLTHGMRFAVMMVVVIVAALLLDARFWLAISYPLYALALLLLVAVELFGATRMGATRWLDLGPLSLQPSELMKVGILLALARYYHQLDARRTGTVIWVIPPFLMILAPVALVMHQPDLGTAVVGDMYAVKFVLLVVHLSRVDELLRVTADPLATGAHKLQTQYSIRSAVLV
jgi:rod shape determining protein RodA